ncbi:MULTISPECIES: MarR family winged helix-turn-helix transcriptional regulator [unclassified Fibrobacter]|uniref:MarR family winged helix-turn-helix transcriptional regulator n=1 Tax=unclassified Fibrobacter TaxID=2634177 RepID=UPI000D6C5463|nr:MULTISPECIES: MarR family transcriptional regulator [unclassified Fibrobacter]PWJ61143.1 DNA-binding MarR family transcriptional regulator [Fibrobacter sp. UWR4]PZW65601.1 DNA-binding MarR family transcriptional regulator [Fibrobacter sp. UWR1]
MHESLKLDNQLCFRLYTASRLVTQAYRPLLDKLKITYPQYLVMLILWESDNVCISTITERLLLETNTVTPLLKRMEDLGLIKRMPSKEDARQKIISLTTKGRKLQDKAKEVPTCLVSEMAKRNVDLQGLSSITPILDNLIHALQ